MATHRFSISAIPLILGAVMLMNFGFLITKVSARHLLVLQIPKVPKHELPKQQIPILPMSEVLPLPKVELPSLPNLRPLEKRKLSDELPKPVIPLPKLSNLPKPELPKLPELPIFPH